MKAGTGWDYADFRHLRRPIQPSSLVASMVLLPCQFSITFCPMKTISVKLPTPLAAWLTQEAQELGRSKSAIVRKALEQQRDQPGKGSCLDLMEDLCGSVRGPRDLSTNPKHLSGFGR
jgi:hypothetical protein